MLTRPIVVIILQYTNIEPLCYIPETNNNEIRTTNHIKESIRYTRFEKYS